MGSISKIELNQLEQELKLIHSVKETIPTYILAKIEKDASFRTHP
jgi:hypothetical protein